MRSPLRSRTHSSTKLDPVLCRALDRLDPETLKLIAGLAELLAKRNREREVRQRAVSA